MPQPLPVPPEKSVVPESCRPLARESLYRRADLSALSFTTTAEIAPLGSGMAQKRVLDAVKLSVGIDHAGFNMFVIGPRQLNMREAVKSAILSSSDQREPPSDWIYVNNFDAPERPVAIELPAGTAPRFHDAMHELVEDLKVALPAAFEGEDYSTRRAVIDENARKAQAEAFRSLRERAEAKGIVVLRTPLGFALAPAVEGTVVPPEEFSGWPEDKRNETMKSIGILEKDLERVVRSVPQIEKEHRAAIRDLNRETAEIAVGHLIEETKARFVDQPRIATHLETVRSDLLKNVAMFIAKDESPEIPEPPLAHSPFERYEVNVLITHDPKESDFPLIEEIHPTLGNLIGRVDHIAHQGMLVTDFRMIRCGAVHRANGGYLLLDVRHLLMEPFSWQALKRTLQRGTIVIEDAARLMGLASTISLVPDPIPLNIKIVLFGDRLLYFLLSEFDAELAEHFKVLADFEDDFDRSSESEASYAHIIAALASREGLRPLSREAVLLLVEHAARLAGDSHKLTLLTERLRDLIVEADYFAAQRNAATSDAVDVQQAIDQKITRNARIRDRAQESIERQLQLIDTAGAEIGQVNALSVISLGGFSFGRPSRVTCRVRPGSGKLIDIEREVELGGATHSKGVLIIAGFLAGRYALDTPMSVYASLVFEQSYSGVEGDSASAAELFSLLSALSEVPLRQDMAVTGSVNQHGRIQAIGGVNEKIEGFFDICSKRGLSGTQAVIIPRSNVQHLMLRSDVLRACEEGKFAVHAIESIDEGISLLTGQDAGTRDERGLFPEDSVNARVETRLRAFAEVRRHYGEAFAAEAKGTTSP